MNQLLQKAILLVCGKEITTVNFSNEKINFLTHFFGLLLTIVGSFFLVREALTANSIRTFLAVSVFCVCSVNLFFASTICHSRLGARSNQWGKYDHCAIYLFIAGTFTPICLLNNPQAWSWFTLILIWIVTIILITKEVNSGVTNAPATWIYLATGWVGIALALPLIRSLDSLSISYCLIGAALYSVGTVFYVRSNCWSLAHGVWHAFVVGGATAHFFMFYSILQETKLRFDTLGGV